MPIPFVRDVPAGAAFFRDKPGFDVDFLHGTPSFHGAVSRGAIFAQAIVKQPWGGADFQVRDPDGNAISFVTYS